MGNTIQIPISEIIKAVNAAAGVKKAFQQLDEARFKACQYITRDEARMKRGEDGETAFRDALTACEHGKQAATEQALQVIQAARDKALQSIADQALPDGNDLLEGAADLALLNAGLVRNVDQLKTLLRRHDGSVAFTRLAVDYCARHGWEDAGISDMLTNENSVMDYTRMVFDKLAVAARFPGDLTWQQYCAEPNEYARSADAHGLAECFWDSDGARLRDTIKQLFPDAAES